MRAKYQGRILERFTVDLILRWTFETQISPNSKKLWISMQRAVLYIDTLWSYWSNFLIQKFLELGIIMFQMFTVR